MIMRSGASVTPRMTSPPALIADHRKAGIFPSIFFVSSLGVGMNAAHHLLYRRVTLEYGDQPTIEHRSHAVRDGGALDGAVAGALANKLLDRGARHQYLSDGPAA